MAAAEKIVTEEQLKSLFNLVSDGDASYQYFSTSIRNYLYVAHNNGYVDGIWAERNYNER